MMQRRYASFQPHDLFKWDLPPRCNSGSREMVTKDQADIAHLLLLYDKFSGQFINYLESIIWNIEILSCNANFADD